MATCELEKLIEMWRGEKLTPEQAIGHVLQHLLALRAQLYEAEGGAASGIGAPQGGGGRGFSFVSRMRTCYTCAEQAKSPGAAEGFSRPGGVGHRTVIIPKRRLVQ
jgi:hypothetical protein